MKFPFSAVNGSAPCNVTGLPLITRTAESPRPMPQIVRLPPLERLGRPEDIAGVVSFLVGPDGGWINGQTLRANGGMV